MIRILLVIFGAVTLLLFFSIQQLVSNISILERTALPQKEATPSPEKYTKHLPTSAPITTSKPTPTLFFTPTPTVTPIFTPTPTQPPRTHIRVMPLGDSITDGSVIPGGFRTQLWNQLVSNGAKIDFVGSLSSGTGNLGDWDHEGHIGWETGQLAAHVGNWIANTQPDIVLIHSGTNDLDHGTPAGEMTNRLSLLIANIYAANPDTYIIVSSIVLLTRGDGASRDAYNASIPGVVAQYASQGKKIVFVDMSHLLTAEDLLDGIHPNATGYSKMASMWYPIVNSVYQQLAGSLH